MTCAKTQGFLGKHKVSVTEQTDAKKATIKGAAALGVLDGVDELYVAKGKKVEHVDLKKAKPDRATLLGLLLGFALLHLVMGLVVLGLIGLRPFV